MASFDTSSNRIYMIYNESMESDEMKRKNLIDTTLVTRTDPRPAVRPAEGPNSFHWKKVKKFYPAAQNFKNCMLFWNAHTFQTK